MPMQRQSPQDEEQKFHPWMRAALDLGRLNQSWAAIRHGSEEHGAWERYFKGLGWVPQVFKKMEAGDACTMPVQWPEWLPAGWEPMATTARVIHFKPSTQSNDRPPRPTDD